MFFVGLGFIGIAMVLSGLRARTGFAFPRLSYYFEVTTESAIEFMGLGAVFAALGVWGAVRLRGRSEEF
jgi:hypothetical protein